MLRIHFLDRLPGLTSHWDTLVSETAQLVVSMSNISFPVFLMLDFALKERDLHFA